ncbi:unnamed protein product [Rotaria sp. Silwood1]|nr:unnamed protein product [Rotaria sp. Silwood1]
MCHTSTDRSDITITIAKLLSVESGLVEIVVTVSCGVIIDVDNSLDSMVNKVVFGVETELGGQVFVVDLDVVIGVDSGLDDVFVIELDMRDVVTLEIENTKFPLEIYSIRINPSVVVVVRCVDIVKLVFG